MRIKAQDESDTSGNEETDVAIPVVKPTQSRQEIARVAGISSNAVLQIEKIQRAAAPELVQAVRDGTISISAAAAVATLPSDEQAAAVAGGRKELQQAAKQVREKIREQKSPAKMNKVPESQETENPPDTANGAMDQVSESVILQQRIKALEAENAALVEKITQLNAALSAATATN
jgi:transcriptional regulator with XRE-family HTH domain